MSKQLLEKSQMDLLQLPAVELLVLVEKKQAFEEQLVAVAWALIEGLAVMVVMV